VDDWVRLHNSGGDGSAAVMSMSLCRVLVSLAQDFLHNFFGIYPVLDNPDGWKSVALVTAADGDSPDKIQGRSHQSPRVTFLAYRLL